MGLRSVVCAASAALALVWSAVAQAQTGSFGPETVKLEYKLKPGTELIYKTSGTAKGNVAGEEGEAAFSGPECFLIADIDATSGVMLVGQATAMSATTKTSGSPEATSQEQMENEFSVCRMDRSGHQVLRKVKDAGKAAFTMMMLRGLDQRHFDVTPLPGKPVAIGATWESTTDAGLAGMPITCKVVSTLAAIKTVDGHKCAVIQSKLTPTGSQALPGAGDITGTEEVETLFDLEEGLSRSEKGKLDFKISAQGQNVSMTAEMVSVLDSVKALPAEEAARESAVVRAFDAAISAAYDGEYDKAVAGLEALKPADLPEAWKPGIDNAIGTLKQIAQFAQGGGPAFGEQTPAERAQQLFAQAEQARQEQKWADAVAKYKELAEKYPDHALVPSALIAAANITETNLNDKKSADELRQRALALQEKRAAADPMELYKLAALAADSGDLEKAVATYRKFLASSDAKIPANTRVLAQYRIAGLLEKQNKKAEAAEAYKAVAAISADDDYSMKLKEQAKKRLEALAAP